MKRRVYLKTTVEVGFIAGAASIGGPFRRILATEPDDNLVAVKNGTADWLFDAGIVAVGGMRRFVRPNQTVLVNPNMVWDVIDVDLKRGFLF